MPASVQVTSTNPVQVVVQQSAVPQVVIGMARQGPTGPPGDAPSIMASETIGGHRVVAATTGGEGMLASASDSSAQRVLGLSTAAAMAGTLCALKRSGLMEWPAGGLTPNALIFLAEGGLITQTPPTTGWLRQVGVAADSSTISIDIGPAFWLGA